MKTEIDQHIAAIKELQPTQRESLFIVYKPFIAAGKVYNEKINADPDLVFQLNVAMIKIQLLVGQVYGVVDVADAANGADIGKFMEWAKNKQVDPNMFGTPDQKKLKKVLAETKRFLRTNLRRFPQQPTPPLRNALYVETFAKLIGRFGFENLDLVEIDTLLQSNDGDYDAIVAELTKSDQPFLGEVLGYPVETPQKDKLPKLRDSGNPVITEANFEWAQNSCWADSVMTALFKVPERWFERQVRKAKYVIPNGEDCQIEDAQKIHNAIIDDINVIQGSDKRLQCATRKVWTKCVAEKPTKAGDEWYVPEFMISLISFYNLLELVEITYFVEEQFNFMIKNQNTKIAAFYMSHRASDTPETFKVQVPKEIMVKNTKQKFVLGSVILDRSGHFTTLVKDPNTEEWWFFDAKGKSEIFSARKLEPNEMNNNDIPLLATKKKTLTVESENGFVDIDYLPHVWLYFPAKD